LTAGGAHLVITTMAPRAPNELMTASAAADETSRYLRLNELYTQYASAHPETVSVVDFAGAVCPGGPPCPRTVDGINLRPLDGLHFTPETAGWAAQWLLDAVLACRAGTAGWLCPAQQFTGTGSHAARK
jgi:lysophospholipase L1-like esterase